ncbi:MAG: hypothetical protein H0X25_04165 [Acidobacteriales bacterium]|nr:hypothetical protein [Terriglobales bacterium]
MSNCKLCTFCIVSFLFLAAWASTPAHAQATPAVTGVTLSGGTGTCPPDDNFYSAPPGSPPMTCYDASIVNCPNATNVSITFGYAPHAGTLNNGTIVLLSGDGGTSASTDPENTYAQDYQNLAGFGIVEVAYRLEWHNAGADVAIRYEAQSYREDNEAMIADAKIKGICKPQKRVRAFGTTNSSS